MDYGKYVVAKNHYDCEFGICFDSTLAHNYVGRGMDIVSAGFFCVDGHPTENDVADISVSVWGKSVSLKKTSRPEDAKILKKFLRKEYQNG